MTRALALVVGALVLVRIGRSAWTGYTTDRSITRGVFAAWRPWMIPGAVGTIAATAATGTVLYFAVPPLRWGWWTLLTGTPGGALTGPGDAAGTGFLAGVVLMLAFAVPILAYGEEAGFRSGAEHRTRWHRRRRDLAFGLMHLVMGIPIAFALAIAVAGAAYTAVYLRGYRAVIVAHPRLDAPLRYRIAAEQATFTSAAFHATYNWIVVGLLGAAVVTTVT